MLIGGPNRKQNSRSRTRLIHPGALWICQSILWAVSTMGIGLMGIGLYVWYLIPKPLPRASLPFPRVSLRALLSILVAESPCGPEPCLQSAETRSTTSIKGLAARIWSADAGSLVFGERAALEQPIPTPLPVSCLTSCFKKSDDYLCFVVCTRYAG